MSAHLSPARLAELALDPLPSTGNAHLQECAACRAQLATFQSAMQTMRRTYLPPEAPAFSESKAVANAIAAAERASVETPGWAVGRRWLLAALLPVAAAVLLVMWPRAMPADGFRIMSGSRSVAVVGRTLEVAEQGEPAMLQLADGTRIQADPGTRLAIEPAARVLLSRGRVQLWVEKRTQTPLVVATDEAEVRVVGTVFVVARAESKTLVQVTAGIVEVTGASLPAPKRVGAGESLAVEPPALAQSTEAKREPEPAAVVVASEPVVAAVEPAAPRTKPLRSVKKRTVDAERVRSFVRAGQFDEARTLLASERAQATSARETAELDIVEAEMLLAQGRRDQALNAYLTVSERHRSLRQGEAALFAAAQLSLSSNRPLAERLLRRYLERYPNGGFQHEVDSLLGALKTP